MKNKQTTIAKEWDWKSEWIKLSRESGMTFEQISRTFDLMRRLESQTRATTLDECLVVIGDDEEKARTKETTGYFKFEVRNNLRQELRQAINSLKTT